MAGYEIPLFCLSYGKEEMEAVLEPIRNNWISTGPKCSELERMFSKMFGAKYACAVTNCTAALHLACYVLGIGPGDEVICPSLTFAATVNCIKYVGAKPVFCDIEGLDNFSISPAKIKELINENTKAIIPMHFAGFACDMEQIMRIASEYGLDVIEDACHGPLSEYRGKKLGTIGDIGCFSFFSNKNISAGEGGMIVTDNEEIYQKIKLARSHGMTTLSFERASGHATSYEIETLGFNYRMDDLRASLACAQLKKLEKDLIRRREIREIYESRLGDCEKIVIPYKCYDEPCSNYIFPIVIRDHDPGMRDLLRNKLQEKGIQTSVHYPAVHRFALYREYQADVPVTEYVTDHEVTLPMYGKLTDGQVNHICDVIFSVLEKDHTYFSNRDR